jgi:hypothetical protein
MKKRLSQETEEEIRKYHRRTNGVFGLETTVGVLLDEVDALRADIDCLKNPSDGRCMEISALREHCRKLEDQVESLRTLLTKACLMFRRIANLEIAINSGDGRYWNNIADELERTPGEDAG